MGGQRLDRDPGKQHFFFFPFAIAGIAENAYATESEPTSAAALIREWKALEAVCRGSNESWGMREKLNSVGQEPGQKGRCFNGYVPAVDG